MLCHAQSTTAQQTESSMTKQQANQHRSLAAFLAEK
jgi:hypothetical protein